MKKNIKKFEDWEQEEVMDDIVDEDELEVKKDTSEEEFNPDEWEIESIIDVMDKDPRESGENDDITETAITFDANIGENKVKRGSYIWIVAFVKRSSGTSHHNPSRQVVLKTRIIDYYYGLSHLNKVINK